MKEQSIKTSITFILISIALAGFSVLSGCNTMEGLGQDVDEVGDSLEEEAREHN